MRCMSRVGRVCVKTWWNASALKYSAKVFHANDKVLRYPPALLDPAIELSSEHDAHIPYETLHLLLPASRAPHLGVFPSRRPRSVHRTSHMSILRLALTRRRVLVPPYELERGQLGRRRRLAVCGGCCGKRVRGERRGKV
jgi:hypothetical protein